MYDFLVKHCQFALEIADFQSLNSVANLKISWSFSLEKILRSTRTLDCDKYRLKSKGKFFSFCWAIFLYFSTPISWVMSYDKKCPRFVDPVRGWVNRICMKFEYITKVPYCRPGWPTCGWWPPPPPPPHPCWGGIWTHAGTSSMEVRGLHWSL